MKKICSSLGIAGCLLLFAGSAAIAAQNWPTKAFDVTYTVTSPQSTCTLRMASDGKGHMRTESSTAGSSVVSLIDYTDMTQTSLIEQGKMAMKTKIPPEGAYISDAESAKKANAKALGTKVIGGHPCHGWAYTTPSGKSEVWTADDIGCFVLSTTTGQAGKSTTEMKSFSKVVPGSDSFKIPAGYKLMSM